MYEEQTAVARRTKPPPVPKSLGEIREYLAPTSRVVFAFANPLANYDILRFQTMQILNPGVCKMMRQFRLKLQPQEPFGPHINGGTKVYSRSVVYVLDEKDWLFPLGALKQLG